MGGFDDDPMAPVSYSRLLFAEGFDFGSSSTLSPPPQGDDNENLRNMLRFADLQKSEPGVGISQKPGSESRPKNDSFSSRKRPESESRSGFQPGEKIIKKSKPQTRHAKVGKKERLGERITILQQLVSPFGKTDTASVLQQVLGYIKFLQDQVQVLCSPYLQRQPATPNQREDEGKNGSNCNDLRNRGLCVAPMEIGRHVAAEPNGADLWSSSSTEIFK